MKLNNILPMLLNLFWRRRYEYREVRRTFATPADVKNDHEFLTYLGKDGWRFVIYVGEKNMLIERIK